MNRYEKMTTLAKIVNPGSCYSSYEGWIVEHAPEYLEKWKIQRRNNLRVGEIGKIVKMAPHPNGDMLHLIEIGEHYFIMGKRGIKTYYESVQTIEK